MRPGPSINLLSDAAETYVVAPNGEGWEGTKAAAVPTRARRERTRMVVKEGSPTILMSCLMVGGSVGRCWTLDGVERDQRRLLSASPPAYLYRRISFHFGGASRSAAKMAWPELERHRHARTPQNRLASLEVVDRSFADTLIHTLLRKISLVIKCFARSKSSHQRTSGYLRRRLQFPHVVGTRLSTQWPLPNDSLEHWPPNHRLQFPHVAGTRLPTRWPLPNESSEHWQPRHRLACLMMNWLTNWA